MVLSLFIFEKINILQRTPYFSPDFVENGTTYQTK